MHYFSYNENKQHGTPEFPVDYYYVDEKHSNYNMPFHWHKEWEIIYILEGELLLSIDGQELCAQRGDVVLLREGTLHGGVPKDCIYECFDFYFHGLFANVLSVKEHLRPFYRHVFSPVLYYPHTSDICSIVEEMLSAFRNTKEEGFCKLMTLSTITRLFATIYEKGYYHHNTETKSDISTKIEQLKPVLEYIEANFSKSLSLTELSGIIGMNPKYFCRFFSSITQQTPMNYVNYYRIEQAASLLSSTDRSVTDVGLDCGFNDTCHFVKTFKKYKGVTPKQYQKKNS